jgi:hypothetical protein
MHSAAERGSVMLHSTLHRSVNVSGQPKTIIPVKVCFAGIYVPLLARTLTRHCLRHSSLTQTLQALVRGPARPRAPASHPPAPLEGGLEGTRSMPLPPLCAIEPAHREPPLRLSGLTRRPGYPAKGAPYQEAQHLYAAACAHVPYIAPSLIAYGNITSIGKETCSLQVAPLRRPGKRLHKPRSGMPQRARQPPERALSSRQK